jgi:FAD-NAD(P)-binding
MAEIRRDEIASLLAAYRVPGKPLYIVGTFDTGVTVFSQQVRALNLVWALMESDLIPTSSSDGETSATKVAIVGGGFAGLSVAAGLIKKEANARITIFEERDTLLPLQQGCDSRWLHPRIYDWPDEGSNAAVAMLPVLNWTAARASDVVVQILTEWKSVLSRQKHPTRLYCNARHLQIHEVSGDESKLQIEWVGEHRDAQDATTSKDAQPTAIGATENFDIVILAVGFGLERGDTKSYWRNEILGQPNLDQGRRTYLISGQGDGAMIDLLRLRISQYRQDRILDELFHGRGTLLDALREIHREYSTDSHKCGLFNTLELLAIDQNCAADFLAVCEEMARRLRRDTEVILHLKVRKLSELFDPRKTRISFQNKLLVYFLYKCGGFFPSSLEEILLTQQHSIPHERIIRRHGTLRDEQLKRLLSDELYESLERRRGRAVPDPFSQSDKMRWSGGYFGFPGPLKNAAGPDDPIRESWRNEYLPGPTMLVARSFCASLAGALLERHSEPGRLRVTLHRTLPFHDEEELLQQTCDYEGTKDARGATSSAARTFPARNATIGLAYKCRRIVRSVQDAKPETLQQAMGLLQLNVASRTMSGNVGFLLAIPILQPEEPLRFHAPSPVAGIMFIDSTAHGFFIEDDELKMLVSMIDHFVYSLTRESESFVGNGPVAVLDRICNVPLKRLGTAVPRPEPLPDNVKHAFELVSAMPPPRTQRPFQFNFDYSDFIPVES